MSDTPTVTFTHYAPLLDGLGRVITEHKLRVEAGYEPYDPSSGHGGGWFVREAALMRLTSDHGDYREAFYLDARQLEAVYGWPEVERMGRKAQQLAGEEYIGDLVERGGA